MGEKELDVFEVIHVRRADRIIAAFDVAIVGGEIQRGPAALVGKVHVSAVLEQVGTEFVIAVLGGDQQGAPAVAGGLVDVGSGSQERLYGFEIVRASCVDESGKASAIFGRRRSTADDSGRDGRVIIVVIHTTV